MPGKDNRILRKRGTPPHLPAGKRWYDRNLTPLLGTALLLFATVATYVSWQAIQAGYDIEAALRRALAPGGAFVLIGTIAWGIYRERAAKHQGGIERQLGTFTVELSKANARADAAVREAAEARQERDAERAEAVALRERFGQSTDVMREAVVQAREQSSLAHLALSEMSAAVSAVQAAGGSIEAVREGLAAAVRVRPQPAAVVEVAPAETVVEPTVFEQAAREAAELEHARLEEEQSAHVRAAGARLRAANAAADAARVITGEVTAAAPLPPLPAAEPAPVEEVAVHEQVHYFHPDWTPPATGVTPVVPPKRHPDDDTAIHTFIHSGRWPEGFDPDNPPPRRVRRSE